MALACSLCGGSYCFSFRPESAADNGLQNLLIALLPSCSMNLLLPLRLRSFFTLNIFSLFYFLQVTQLVYDACAKDDDLLQHVKYVGYDSTCKVVPFLERKRRSSLAWVITLLTLKWFVDLFHINKHKESCCRLENVLDNGVIELNPECRFHPKLPEFADVNGGNNEIQEITSKWFNRFRNMTRSMGAAKAEFFMWEMATERNKRLKYVREKRSYSRPPILNADA